MSSDQSHHRNPTPPPCDDWTPLNPATPTAPREHWRPGRKVGRTLYIHHNGNPHGDLIGVVDTPQLATAICAAMNRYNAEHPAAPEAAS